MTALEEIKALGDWMWGDVMHPKHAGAYTNADFEKYKKIAQILWALSQGEVIMHEDKAKKRTSYSLSIEEAEKLFPRLRHQ
jgi:hypothetical protein